MVFHLESQQQLVQQDHVLTGNREVTQEEAVLGTGQRLIVTRSRLYGALACAVVLFNVSVLVRAALPVLTSVFTVTFVSIVPGLLLLAAIGARPRDPWRHGYYGLCLSLVILMVTGLSVNWLLPQLGVHQPLSTGRILPALDIAIVGIAAVAWRRQESMSLMVRWRGGGLPTWALAALLLPILAALGAMRLDNNGSNIVTMVMLITVATWFGVALSVHGALDENAVRFTLACVAVALLLMTSLRGWTITGHDIQREYGVFLMTRNGWSWNMGALPGDPYNACLSITILPTMLASLLHVADVLVFKLVFQVFFAFTAVGVYLLMRHFTRQRVALLAAYFFVAFPTFFTDMPMLNRQEIALVLAVGMFMAVLFDDLGLRKRRVLFLVLGAGVVISHYSTTYSLLAILFGSTLLLGVLRLRAVNGLLVRPLERLHVQLPAAIVERQRPMITSVMVLALAVVTLTWNLQLTHTGGNLREVTLRSLSGIEGNAQNDTRSLDTSVSIFNLSRPDPAAILARAVSEQDAAHDANDPAYYGGFVNSRYPVSLLPDASVPLTPLGHGLEDLGVSAQLINTVARGGWARLIQLLTLVGFAVIWIRRKYSQGLTSDYLGLTTLSLAFVGLLVVLPSLSIDYGLLRAFQQTLILMALPAAIGVYGLTSRWAGTTRHRVGTALFSLTFFLSTSGLLPELIGGFAPELHLRNAGIYYETYLDRAEGSGMAWLIRERGPRQGPAMDVESDEFGSLKLRTNTGVDPVGGILPGEVRRDSYVFLDRSTVTAGRAYLLYGMQSYGYVSPLQFLDENKDLLFSNQGSRVYR